MTNRVASLRIERKKLSDLLPHPRNPRRHPDPGSPAWNVLVASLEFDYFDPIVWNRRNGFLVSGHLRKKVLESMGIVEADVVVVDYDEPTHLCRMIAANKLIGEDDDQALKDMLLEVDTGSIDMSLTGYDAAELEKMMTAAADVPEGTPAMDAANGRSERVRCPKCGCKFSI